MKKIINLLIIFIIKSNIIFSKDNYELIKLITDLNNEKIEFVNLISIDGKIIVESKFNSYEIDGINLINRKKINKKNIPSSLISKNDTSFSYLFLYNSNKSVNIQHFEKNNFLYVLNKKKLYIFKKDFFLKELNGISVRTISKNFVGTYSGIFNLNNLNQKISNIKTDSYLREYDRELYINYSGLAKFNKDSKSLDLIRDHKNELYIGEKNWGLSLDILKLNNSNFISATSKGIIYTDLKKTLKIIDTTIDSRNSKEKNPKIIYYFNEEGIDERVLIYSNKKILLFYPKKLIIEVLTELKNDVVYFSVFEDKIFYMDSTGIYFLESNKPKIIFKTENDFHSLIAVNKNLLVLSSNNGLFKYDIKRSKLTTLINDEMNHKALLIRNDTLYAGGIEGLYISSINNILNYEEVIIPKSNSLLEILFIIIIGVLIIISILIYIKLNKKVKIISKDELLKSDIQKYIENNLNSVTVNSIMNNFNVSYRKLNNIYKPIKIGKIIEIQRLNKLNKLNKSDLSIEEISNKTGYSISYLKILKNSKRKI